MLKVCKCGCADAKQAVADGGGGNLRPKPSLWRQGHWERLQGVCGEAAGWVWPGEEESGECGHQESGARSGKVNYKIISIRLIKLPFSFHVFLTICLNQYVILDNLNIHICTFKLFCCRLKADHVTEMEAFAEKAKAELAESKRKQWCYNCEEAAIYWCCWNTAYCSTECQQEHWRKEHKKDCRRK